MAFQRLPGSVQTLYAELLDQVVLAQAEEAAVEAPQGSFVAKTVKGGRYWYLQVSEGGHKTQRYLGRETPVLLAWIERAKHSRERTAADREHRASLCRMLAAGGAAVEPAPVVRLLELLAQAGVFRRGGVLVGTQSFRVYGNMLGVQFEGQPWGGFRGASLARRAGGSRRGLDRGRRQFSLEILVSGYAVPRMGFHDDCLVLDGHTDVPTRLWEEPADLAQRLTDRHIDLPRLRQGGVDALVFALYVPASLDAEQGLAHARELYRRSVEGLAAGMVQAATADQIVAAVGRGEIAVVLALENGRPLTLPGALDACVDMGVRYVTLTHWASHEWCDASTGERVHGGLSPDGVEIVRRLNRLGILPDVSHVSDDAVLHVLDVSRVPPVASHSSARALCDHPRNLPDSLIREIARRGGVVMANTYPAFVSPRVSQADAVRMKELLPQLEATEADYYRRPGEIARERARLLADQPLPRAPLSVFVDHLIHLVELGGEEYVGIGTDFDGIPETLDGFEDPSGFPNVTAALLARGVDRSGVKLILGGNFLRLLREAEKAV